jgi:hypothetical protein
MKSPLSDVFYKKGLLNLNVMLYKLVATQEITNARARASA